ncbi:MAG: DUF4907 domain-containing protein [Bacteroidota bacterium]
MFTQRSLYTSGLILIFNSLFLYCANPDRSGESNRTISVDTQDIETKYPVVCQDSIIPDEETLQLGSREFSRTVESQTKDVAFQKENKTVDDMAAHKSTDTLPVVSTREEAKENETDSVSVEIKTFHTEHGWGYDIFVNGNKYIHQEQIPAVPGIKGFETEEDAKKTAELVSHKIRNNIMPPSVTPEELENLGVWKSNNN